MKKSVLFLLIALVLLVSCNQDEVHVHKFDEGTVTTAPTCTADGVKTFKCQCGETKTEEVPALGHDKVEVEAKEATCTEKGWKAYEKCKREGCDYSTYEEIEAKGHTEGTPVTTAATCTAAGSTVVKCTVCNEVISTTPIEKLEHTSNAGVVTTESTCTKEGEKTFSCIVCNTVLSTEKVPATGHTEGTPVTTAATCTAAGSTVVKCTVCNEVISTTPIEKLAHDLEKSSTTAATCINKAVVTYKCKNCDYTENREEGAVDPTNHTGDTEWVVTTEAKFFTKGVETKKCKSCNTLLSETREVDFKDPTGLWMTTGNDVLSFASGKLTLGAIQSGYYVEFGPYTYKIEDDKFSYSSDSTHWISVDILGETADTMSLKIDGKTKTFTRKTTTAHVHTYKTEKWACEDIVDKDGYIEMSLHSRVTNCENHDELKFVDFYNSHSYENGKCKICDCDERFEINIKRGTSFYFATNKAGFKLPGDSTVTYTLGDTTTTYHGGDTYTPTGKILITDVAYAQVSDTDKAKYSAILSTHVHSFDDGTVTTAATCTTEGVKTFKCQCGETKTEKVPATGHTETSVTTAATCTAAGSTVVKCTVCNEVISTTPIEKLAHDFEDTGTVKSVATCQAAKVVTYKCKNCTHTEDRSEGDKDSTNHTGDTEWKVATSADEAKYFTEGTETEYCKSCNATTGNTRKYFRALTGFWEGKVTTSKGDDAIVTLSFNDASQLKIGTNVNGNYREDSNPYDYAVSTDGITCLYYTFTDPSEDESNKGEVDDKISLTVPLIDILDADTNDTVEFTRKTVEAHTHTYADTWEPVEIKDNNGYITYVGHSKKMECTAHSTFAIEGNHEYSDAGVCTLCGAESYYEVTQKVVEKGAPSLDTFCYVKKGESFKLPGESTVTYTLGDTTTTYHGGDTYTPTGKIFITDDAYANVSASDKAEYSAILSTYVQ